MPEVLFSGFYRCRKSWLYPGCYRLKKAKNGYNPIYEKSRYFPSFLAFNRRSLVCVCVYRLVRIYRRRTSGVYIFHELVGMGGTRGSRRSYRGCRLRRDKRRKRGRLSDSGDHVLQRLYAVYYGVRNYARLHIFQRAGKVFYRQRLFQTRAFTGFRDCRRVSVCPRNGFFKTVSVPFARLSARLLDLDDRPYFSYTFGLRRLGTAGKMEFLLPVSVYEYR